MKTRLVVGQHVYRRVVAQDPVPDDEEPEVEPAAPVVDDTGEEMVQELRKSPAENWKKFLQPIIINIRNRYGLEVGDVSLMGPKVKSEFTSPRYGFYIVGHVRFEPEVPDDVVKEHGEPPYAFEAAITPDGDLISSVNIRGSEG
jgi:hypothetical protein